MLVAPGTFNPARTGRFCTCSGMVKGPPSSTRMRWLWVLSCVKRCWAQTDPKDPPPKIITSNMRAFGLRDESVLAKASSRPLQTYRPRTSLLNGVYCAVAGVGITIYSLRRSWGTILDSGLTASRAYRAMWSATNAPAGERLVFHRVSGTRTGYAPDPRRLEFRGEKQKRAYNRARPATSKTFPVL